LPARGCQLLQIADCQTQNSPIFSMSQVASFLGTCVATSQGSGASIPQNTTSGPRAPRGIGDNRGRLAWDSIDALMACVVGVPGYVQASEATGVGVVTTLVGEATVVRTAAAQPRNLQMRDHVLPLDRITTKERSMVHVLMGGKALLTVKELSVVTVTEDGGRATVDLQSGKVGLAVVHEKMKPGDVIEAKWPHAGGVLRGTVLVVA